MAAGSARSSAGPSGAPSGAPGAPPLLARKLLVDALHLVLNLPPSVRHVLCCSELGGVGDMAALIGLSPSGNALPKPVPKPSPLSKQGSSADPDWL